MKWVLRGLAGLFAIALIACVIFWGQIQDIRALMSYSAVFEPERIDENFRTLHEKYPSITIEPSGVVAEFDTALEQDVFPETFDFYGEILDLEAALEQTHVSAMLILHENQKVYETYSRGNSADQTHIEMSVSKSITSILIGVAHDEGDLPDLDEKVTTYIPELIGTGYDEVTVQQVLDMTSGIRYNEDYGDLNSDLVQTVVATLRGSLDEFSTTMISEREPGEYNHYASIETQVLAWVLRRATGERYVDYFQEKLWNKIGAEGQAHILTDHEGEAMAYGGINLRVRDLARIGQMMLNNGVSMTGERVVSEAWISQSTTPDSPQTRPGLSEYSSSILGYKNQWWIPQHRDGNDYSAIGIFGQYLYINPERGVVIAVNSAYPEYNEDPEADLRMLAALQAIAKHVSE